MNEIKKCPFCGGEVRLAKMNHGLSCRGYEAQFSIACNRCNFKFGNEISRYIVNENGQIETVEDGISKLIERWNERAEEPQEHKESNVEWALNEIKKGTFFYNVCNLAHLTKWYVPCVEEDCGECEFRDKKHAINYLLAPHEENDHE